eukprot:757953-Hanusia_phi.AAC.2
MREDVKIVNSQCRRKEFLTKMLAKKSIYSTEVRVMVVSELSRIMVVILSLSRLSRNFWKRQQDQISSKRCSFAELSSKVEGKMFGEEEGKGRREGKGRNGKENERRRKNRRRGRREEGGMRVSSTFVVIDGKHDQHNAGSQCLQSVCTDVYTKGT